MSGHVQARRTQGSWSGGRLIQWGSIEPPLM